VSPRKARLSSDEMIRLQRNGFAIVGTRGSHCKLRNKAGITVIVPLGRDPLKMGTQTAILAQAGISLP
jgi:predicted RNA binding protein YcfA (HicA-like mRNA interferase family)